MKLIVHPRIQQRHPRIRPRDVAIAWLNRHTMVEREYTDPTQFVALGWDGKARELEMVAVMNDQDEVLIFHALTPPTHNTLKELGIIRR